MKKIQLGLGMAIATLIYGCSNGGNTGNIKGTFVGAEGNMAYFQRFEMGVPVNVDSTVVGDDGSACFSAAVFELDYYQLDLGDNKKLLLILDDGDAPMIEANVNDVYSTNIQGSPESTQYYEHLNKVREFELEKERLRNELRSNQGNAELTEQFNTVNKSHYDYLIATIDKDPGSPIALTALASLDINNELNNFKKVRDAMASSMPHSGFYKQLDQNLNLAEKQAELRAKQQQQQAKGAALLAVGHEAPDFAQQTPDGQVVKLSDHRGKVVLIDFWASWCKPCRRENPNVVKAYNKFKDKGFEILGVSLDRDRGRWLQAIEQDVLTWPQVSDLGFWQNAVAQQYGVTSIPFTVLVDEEGKVIATRLRGPALERKLEELLGA